MIGSTGFARIGEMAKPGEQRKLAAIFSADMVGYSRLMEADERGTIARQKAHRAELIDPEIGEHHGRIVKTTGDGMLVEFASVVDAVECAVAIQRAMLEREAAVPNDRRIRYRVAPKGSPSTSRARASTRTTSSVPSASTPGASKRSACRRASRPNVPSRRRRSCARGVG